MNAVASSSTKTLYRSLLREVRLAAKKPRRERSRSTEEQFRTLLSSSSSHDVESVNRVLMEARDYLRSSRVYAELIKRYNPTMGMTDAEKIHAAARRVGLDTPIGYKPE